MKVVSRAFRSLDLALKFWIQHSRLLHLYCTVKLMCLMLAYVDSCSSSVKELNKLCCSETGFLNVCVVLYLVVVQERLPCILVTI
jgi:hypothetical protein